jgi:hypothetical protein
MTRVSGREYGQRPKLTPESLDRRARVAVRVLEAGAFKKADARQRFVYWISTQEPKDHILFLNGNDLREIVESLGDETDKWPGELVVLELVERNYRGKSYEKYAVAPAPEWNDVLRPLEAPPSSAKKAPKRSPRKPRARKR